MKKNLHTIIISLLSGAVGAFLVIILFFSVLTNSLSFSTYANMMNRMMYSPFNPVNSIPQKDSSGEGMVADGREDRVIAAVKKTSPAVVSIIISKDVPVIEQYYANPFGDQNGNDFFSFPFQIPQYRQNGTKKQQVGGGSGFLVSKDGYIMTNKHVVSDTTAEYTVFTNDGKKHDAQVIARDPSNDLAVIKIDGSDYPYLQFADSEKIQVGQSVIAIGNALAEFRNTVSVGVISGLSRSITAGDNSGLSETIDNVIQTDAAINPGNSGGPLLNLDGDVLGVNVAIAQGSENIGFALPGNIAKNVIDSIQKTGKIVRPFLGVRYIPITPALKSKNSLTVDYGVLVIRGTNQDELAVTPGSAADKAGIVENDIILEADGTRLDDSRSLTGIIKQKKVGDTVKLKILHRGEEKTIDVKLEALPST